MKFSEFLEEMGYKLTEYQKEMAELKEYYKYKLNKKVLTNIKSHDNMDI